MKNKFTKFSLLPLGVSILALSSCNPYPMKWHIISEEAGERAIKEILNAQNKEVEEKTYRIPKLTNFDYQVTVKTNGSISYAHGVNYQYDESSDYLKIDVNTSLNGKEITRVIHYFIKQNNKFYLYKPLSSSIHLYDTYEKFKQDRDKYIYEAPEGGISVPDSLRGNLIPDDTGYFNSNALDETIGYEGFDGYYKKSKQIAAETKGNKEGYTSNFYFQMQENASIEYYEYSYAPIKYFVPHEEIKTALKAKKTLNYKFIYNYLSTFSFDFKAYDINDIETSYTSTCSIDSKVTKDHIIIPE